MSIEISVNEEDALNFLIDGLKSDLKQFVSS